jgi:alcohol dehydrogenase, propanol-preferring
LCTAAIAQLTLREAAGAAGMTLRGGRQAEGAGGRQAEGAGGRQAEGAGGRQAEGAGGRQAEGPGGRRLGGVRVSSAAYIDSASADPGAALRDLGGTSVIVATAASGSSMDALVGGLAPRGTLVVAGAGPDPLTVATPDLIFGTRSIVGHLTGTPIDNEDSLAHGIRPITETMPFTQAPAAYEPMLSGQARFRVVLDIAA